jgi:hypothetical protein
LLIPRLGAELFKEELMMNSQPRELYVNSSNWARFFFLMVHTVRKTEELIESCEHCSPEMVPKFRSITSSIGLQIQSVTKN